MHFLGGGADTGWATQQGASLSKWQREHHFGILKWLDWKEVSGKGNSTALYYLMLNYILIFVLLVPYFCNINNYIKIPLT